LAAGERRASVPVVAAAWAVPFRPVAGAGSRSPGPGRCLAALAAAATSV
jgi:hypothetical protein